MNLKLKFLFFDFMLSFIGFSIPMSILCLILYRNIEEAFFLGILAGFIFALGMVLFKLVIKKTMRHYYNELIKNNNVIYNSPANLLKGKNAIGGWMFITEDSIYFYAHRINLDCSNSKILFSEIDSVKVDKMINYIIIKTKDQNYIKIAVNDRKNVIKLIESKI